MKKNILSHTLPLALLLLVACADSIPLDGDTYVITRQTHQLSASQTTLDFPSKPTGDTSLAIAATQTAWQITDVPDWLTVSPTSGTGEGTVTISCTDNYAEVPRQGVLTIASTDEEWPYTLSVTITQQAYQHQTVSHVIAGYPLTFIPVAGGKFRMGSAIDEAEKPVHEVEVSSFALMQSEVTQGLWKAVTGAVHNVGQAASIPVWGVSWDDCQTFIAQLCTLTGISFRLPTEAEWEYAARGGASSTGYTYSGSNTVSDVAVTRNVSPTVKEVMTLRPNELGLYDMSGNLFEWCSDYYGAYASTSQRNPQGPAEGTERVVRGGSFGYDDGCARVTYRAGRLPETRSEHIGFRLAMDR
ncbi:MAG: SUMF1/EgtB/PvdO family nonheme iron enzyme [Bacteroidaceae bacterium]|nr:SUMF1/EgtB/PvdO family nonheme iron enzyme [Bacteroidaceae bacterium]MBR4779209.1 SUMF1/EgtB/PvdO family nonheme iron enzyme [Bacteroidaceae bacterium]